MTDVIILAGGLGTRLRSVVSEVPKCVAPVAGKPFLHFLLTYLGRQGAKRIILALGYMHAPITDWLESEHFDMDFVYSVEDQPLGTGGAIKQALGHVKSEKALILNGDTFFDVPLADFIASHESTSHHITLALKPMKDFDRYGNVVLAGPDVRAFEEKQPRAEGLINGGCYIIDARCDPMADMPEKFSFETDFLPPEVEKGAVGGFVSDGYFIDIGIPEDFARANDEFKILF